jgi:hypothetical protein
MEEQEEWVRGREERRKGERRDWRERKREREREERKEKGGREY